MKEKSKFKMKIEKEVEKLAEEIIKEIQFPEKSEKPIVLVFGGFQGSGKTMIIDLLKDDLNLVVISSDEIRHKMFEKKYILNERFREIVKETSTKILKNIHQMGYSIAVDDNIIPSRLVEIKKFLDSNKNNIHRLISVCLKTNKEELVRRLNTREYVSGRYQGTASELEGSIGKYGEIDSDKYDLVINTQDLSVEDIVDVVKMKVKQITNS